MRRQFLLVTAGFVCLKLCSPSPLLKEVTDGWQKAEGFNLELRNPLDHSHHHHNKQMIAAMITEDRVAAEQLDIQHMTRGQTLIHTCGGVRFAVSWEREDHGNAHTVFVTAQLLETPAPSHSSHSPPSGPITIHYIGGSAIVKLRLSPRYPTARSEVTDVDQASLLIYQAPSLRPPKMARGPSRVIPGRKATPASH